MGPREHYSELLVTWLVLVGLTLASLGLGQWFHGASWLPVLVAALVWIKSFLVARRFIEANLAHPYVARLVAIFIAIAPAALVLTAFFGPTIARWASL
ncbi:MAG: hypothetical protein U1E96_10365 [Azonexus sp.]